MTDPDWDGATLIRDMIRTEFTSHTGCADVPDERIVLKNTESGKGVDYTQEYILVQETGERGFEYRYLDMSGYDANVTVQVEMATPESRDRREAMWAELVEIAKNNRKRSEGTPGDWDTLTLDGAPFDDEAFNWWAMECVFLFDANARPI